MFVKKKKFIFITIFLFLLSGVNLSLCLRDSFGEFEDVPDWLKRLEFSAEIESDKKPNFYFQTVQPLHQDSTKTHTVFVQPRLSINDKRNDFSIGFGYRNLSLEDWILGGNIFVDYDGLYDHARAGVGLEALGQVVEVRLNSYFKGLTAKHAINSTDTSTTYQKVVDGLDLEFGTPMPYMPWLKMYGGAFWYDFKQFKDKYGWQGRVEAKLNDGLRVEFYSWDDNKGDTEFGGRVRYTMAFSSFTDIGNIFQFSDEAYPNRDLSEELLQPVERNFEIIVEETKSTNGFVVEAGRS